MNIQATTRRPWEGFGDAGRCGFGRRRLEKGPPISYLITIIQPGQTELVESSYTEVQSLSSDAPL